MFWTIVFAIIVAYLLLAFWSHILYFVMYLFTSFFLKSGALFKKNPTILKKEETLPKPIPENSDMKRSAQIILAAIVVGVFILMLNQTDDSTIKNDQNLVSNEKDFSEAECPNGNFLSPITGGCVDLKEFRNDNCSHNFSGTSFLKKDPETGKDICDCNSGFYWNKERTGCYPITIFTESCRNSMGIGSYAFVNNNEVSCECSLGYIQSIDEESCVSVSSINESCELNVGRNSKYAGYVQGGQYICTDPF